MGFQNRCNGPLSKAKDWYVDVSPNPGPDSPIFGTVRLSASEGGVQIDVYPADDSRSDGLVKCGEATKEPIATWIVSAKELKEWAGYWASGNLGLKTRYTNEVYK